MKVILWDNESVWCDLWPKKKCRSQWHIFHGLVFLPYILKTFWWMNAILCDNESVDGPVFLPHFILLKSSDFGFFIFCTQNHFNFIGKVWFRQTALSCDSSHCQFIRFTLTSRRVKRMIRDHMPKMVPVRQIKSKVLMRTLTIDDLDGSHSPSGLIQSPQWVRRDWGSTALPYHIGSTTIPYPILP